MLNPIQLYRYFQIYSKYVGRRLIIVFCLALLAAVVEGFGISLVLPLIASLDETNAGPVTAGAPTGVTAHVRTFVDFLGISHSSLGIIGLIAGLIAFKGIIRFAAEGYGATLSAQLSREITGTLFDFYSRMRYSYYSERNTGHFTNILGVQIPTLIISFGSFKTVATALVTMIAYIGMAFLLDWRFALMAGGAGATVLLVFRRLNRYMQVLSHRTVLERTELSKLLVQTIQAFKYLTSTASIQPLRSSVARSVALLTRYQRNQGLAGSLTNSLREPISIGVILAVMAIQLVVFEAPLAPIFISLILLYRAMGNVMLLQSNWQNLMNQIGSMEAVEKEFVEVSHNLQHTGGNLANPLAQGIVFESVDFRYKADGPRVIKQISLTIPARQTIAFVGPSGAGKSTLVDLLTLLLQPTTGSIYIDGQPANSLNPASWRTQIGYVSQDTVIFDDTVANNIGLWKGNFSQDASYRESIREAARKALALEFVEDLPQGFETLVGDRGIRLSGGQKQRLFIARELFKRPRLLILDEATSALDSASEKAIQSSIEALKGSITIVMIAHRLSTVRDADRVYVIKKGSIIESGAYHELSRNVGSYVNEIITIQSEIA